MSVSYDVFIGSFLEKVTERDLLSLEQSQRDSVVIGYMKRAISGFRKICQYDFSTTVVYETRVFIVDGPDDDLTEIADIVSVGMFVQWLKPYVYKQELLENAINTQDFTTYSPAELLLRVGNAYADAKKDYTQMIREYSFNTGDLTDLHL